MKTKKSQSKTVDVIVPFPGREWEAGEDGLFDDCPICQDLRRMKNEGLVEEVDFGEPRERWIDIRKTPRSAMN